MDMKSRGIVAAFPIFIPILSASFTIIEMRSCLIIISIHKRKIGPMGFSLFFVHLVVEEHITIKIVGLPLASFFDDEF